MPSEKVRSLFMLRIREGPAAAATIRRTWRRVCCGVRRGHARTPSQRQTAAFSPKPAKVALERRKEVARARSSLRRREERESQAKWQRARGREPRQKAGRQLAELAGLPRIDKLHAKMCSFFQPRASHPPPSPFVVFHGGFRVTRAKSSHGGR